MSQSNPPAQKPRPRRYIRGSFKVAGSRSDPRPLYREALILLSFMPYRSTGRSQVLALSKWPNAEQSRLDPASRNHQHRRSRMGPSLKRFRPAPRGGPSIKNTNCHISHCCACTHSPESEDTD